MNKTRNLRETLERYVDVIKATLKSNSVNETKNMILRFIRFLETHHSEISIFSDLTRSHMEDWISNLATRKKRPLCAKTRRAYIFAVGAFFNKMNLWAWKEAPQQLILLASDLPPPEKHLPRPISKKSDRALTKELSKRKDLFSCALLLLRITGMRIGELMNLEVDALQRHSCTKGSLRIPLGKLHSERQVPLDAKGVKLFEKIIELRGEHPPLPHSETKKPTHFLLHWPENCRYKGRPSYSTIKEKLSIAAQAAKITEHVTPHKLRHTYATELLRGGMSLVALKELLGHRSIGMTIRYTEITQEEIRSEYMKAIETIKTEIKIPQPIKQQDEFISLEGLKSLLEAATLHLESFRRAETNTSQIKKLHRLVERIRRIVLDLGKLIS